MFLHLGDRLFISAEIGQQFSQNFDETYVFPSGFAFVDHCSFTRETMTRFQSCFFEQQRHSINIRKR